MQSLHTHKKLMEGLSLERKLEVIKAPRVLAKLSASQRRTALDIVRKRDKRGRLDCNWLASFLKALEALKAEEDLCKAK